MVIYLLCLLLFSNLPYNLKLFEKILAVELHHLYAGAHLVVIYYLPVPVLWENFAEICYQCPILHDFFLSLWNGSKLFDYTEEKLYFVDKKIQTQYFAFYSAKNNR